MRRCSSSFPLHCMGRSYGSTCRPQATVACTRPNRSVTPFGLINDRDATVSVILDAGLMAHDPVNFHPLHNGATTAVAPGDLIRFLEATGHPPRVMALPEPVDAELSG